MTKTPIRIYSEEELALQFYNAIRDNNIIHIKKLIAEEVNVNIATEYTTEYADFPLIQAIRRGNKEIVELLLEAGASIEQTYSNHPLQIAVYQDHKESLDIIRLLLDKGANINAKDEEGYTILMFLVLNFYPASIKKLEILLTYPDLDINATNEWDETALMLAAQYDSMHSIKLLKILLNHPKIDILFENKWKESALSYAIDAGLKKNIKLLTNFINQMNK